MKWVRGSRADCEVDDECDCGVCEEAEESELLADQVKRGLDGEESAQPDQRGYSQ